MRLFETFELVAELTPDEGRRKLSSRRGVSSIAISFFGPVVHLAAPARWRGLSQTGNSFQPTLFCRFAKEGSGAILRCTAAPHPLTLAFMGIWFGALGAFAAFLLVATLAELALGRPTMGAFLALLSVAGMIAGGAVLVRSGWLIGQPDIAFMHDWLLEVVQAHDVGSPPLWGHSKKMPIEAAESAQTAVAAQTSGQSSSFLCQNWHSFLLYPAMVVGIPSFGFLIVTPQILMADAPRIADPTNGKIWPWNNHGIFYITNDWYSALNLAQHVVWVAWPVMIASGFVEVRRRKDKEREVLQEIMRRHADD